MPPKLIVDLFKRIEESPVKRAKEEFLSGYRESRLVSQQTSIERAPYMMENSTMKEREKLRGIENYYVWSLKIRGILRAESLWTITETKQSPIAYSINVDGEELTEVQLNKRKAIACRFLLLSVSDDLVDTVTGHTDPSEAWNAPKEEFASGDHSHVLTLVSQLQTLKLSEGSSVEDYVRRARELKNRLASMGERLSDKHLNQVVLNGLPRSFESIVQTLTHLDPNMSFEKLSANLLSEHYRRLTHKNLHGEDEALSITNKHHGGRSSNQQQYHGGRGRGRWRRNPPWWRSPPSEGWERSRYTTGPPNRGYSRGQGAPWRAAPPRPQPRPQRPPRSCVIHSAGLGIYPKIAHMDLTISTMTMPMQQRYLMHTFTIHTPHTTILIRLTTLMLVLGISIVVQHLMLHQRRTC